jgi:eukaryotic-like serine/threonine-protein kinase
VADPQERLQTALADRYRLVRELGRGGMATVYLAHDLRHDRPIALKVLHSHLAATLGPERFLREIRLAARLQHPHILSVHDSGESEGILWFTMPYVEGESLRERLTREHQLPVDEALRLAREAALALDFAHRHGVIHRDIKPENILLVDGQALVADFGIGRALDSPEEDDRLTQTGTVVGTPAYMSPEQASGEKDLDGRTDIYSLGIVLFEMLAGEPPFTGGTMQSLAAKRLSGEVPSLRRVRPSLAEWIERAVMKALAALPADRYATPAQLAHALEAPAAATTVTRPEPNRQRFRVPSSVALAIGILLTASMGMLIWQRSQHPAEPPGTKMLAVLPFKNLGAPGDQYFTDGLTEEITSRLAGVADLGVISRTSADQYKGTSKTIKQIGQELGVGYVLEGSVRWEKSPDGSSRVRVTPQLIRVSDDRHLWADRYDAVLAEVFQVQSSIADRVITAMDIALGDAGRRSLEERPTNNLEAYDFYLRAKDYYDRGYAREDIRTAIQLCQRAIAVDSTFVRAHGLLSEAYSSLYWFFYDRSDVALGRARLAADRAIRLRPDLPDGHIALGYYYYFGKLDYEAALREFDLARARQPNNGQLAFATAAVQRRQGRLKEAIQSFSRAVELDPRSGVVRFNLGETYVLVRDYERALRSLDEAIEFIPDWPVPYVGKAHALLASGRKVADAKEVVKQATSAVAFPKLAAVMAGVSSVSDFAVTPSFLLTADPDYGRTLEGLSLPSFEDTIGYYQLKADLYRTAGKAALESAYLDSARAILEGKTRAQPREASFHAQLGLVYAYQHRPAEASREAEEAVRLLPVSREAYMGSNLVAAQALIYAVSGRTTQAIDRLEYLLSIPSTLSGPFLRVDPRWAALRANPRFQKLVAGN